MDISPKKKKILKAASECFARFGYEKTTLDDIGKMVGLNKTSLYYYYKSKEDIFAEVIFSEVEEYTQEVCSKILEIQDCREKILTYLREKIRYMQKIGNVSKLSIESLQQVRPIFEKLQHHTYQKEVDFLNDILRTCIKDGKMEPCNSEEVAKSILTILDAIKLKMLQGIDVRFIEQIDYAKLEDEVIFTVSLILDGVMKKEGKRCS